jgi:outer membrane protein TolC
LTAAAFYYHPDLEAARASWAEARAGLVAAGERLNPTVAAGPGFNSSTSAHTVTPWILNLDFDFTIETAGKRRYRVDQAQHLSDAARFAIAATAWQVRARVRQTLLDLYAASETAAALDRQRDLQAANVVLLQRQLAAGAVSSVDVTQARMTLDGVRMAIVDAERQRQDARAQLATAIGVPVSALEGVRLDFSSFTKALADVPAAGAAREALLNRADVLSALAGYDASQSALQLEIAKQYPDLHLGPGYQMDQGSQKWTLLLPVTLPVFNRNRGAIEQADARRGVAAAQMTAVQARALGAVDRALAAYRTAGDKLLVANQLLDAARSLEARAQAQLTAGEISRLDLGLVQVERAARELARIEAIVQQQQAAGNLEDAMQRPVDLPINPLARNPQ